MFDQVIMSSEKMIESLEGCAGDGSDVESKAALSEFTLDVIASCAFGIHLSTQRPDLNKFKTVVKNIFTPSLLQVVRFLIVILMPKLAEKLNLRPFPNEVGDYFIGLTRATMKHRKDNNMKRNDYFQLMLTLKEQEEGGKHVGLTTSDVTEEDADVEAHYTADSNVQFSSSDNKRLFTEEVICANSFIFLIGSESISNTISLVLFELCRHPDVQLKLQQEVDSMLVKCGGWSYEAVRDMVYLDQIIQESQRMYPVLPLLTRECTKDYKIPDSDLTIEKGVLIMIPVVALHHDHQYYPDPEQFKPERFQGNNFKPNSTFLPFGDGPRICIAMRFALMEVKSCLARIMSQYSVKLSSKTQVPLKFVPGLFTPSVKGGIWLSFTKRRTA
ncbi:heme binding [Homalodisca vitripennis]|nr:heme binding [Homalodisca vitripennis]